MTFVTRLRIAARFLPVAAVLCALLVAVPARLPATSVLQFSFAELCAQAELIVEGRVLSADARADDLGGGIGTYVRIRVLDRLKGPDVGTELELRFSGGTVAGHTLSLADMRIPAVGETGIYFVESLTQIQAHPLVGWSQGHFLELVDGATRVPRVFTPAGRAVLGIAATGSGARQRQVLSGSGAAAEVELAAPRAPMQAAMRVSDFKTRVRQTVVAGGARR
jgi:hypothetical protein